MKMILTYIKQLSSIQVLLTVHQKDLSANKCIKCMPQNVYYHTLCQHNVVSGISRASPSFQGFHTLMDDATILLLLLHYIIQLDCVQKRVVKSRVTATTMVSQCR